jgi:hypothetical protein
LQRGRHDDVLVIGDHRAFDHGFDLLALLQKLPSSNLAAARKAPVDAGVTV